MRAKIFIPGIFIFILAAGLCCAVLPARAEEQQNTGVVGTIVEVEGTATVTPDGGAAAPAAVNGDVHMNDVIATGPQSKVFVVFIDNTEFTLSENARLTVNDYVFDPDKPRENKARYSVLQGAFQYVSGLIAKKDDPDVKIDTEVGSIGIRGTDFWAGPLDGQYSVAVNDGRVGVDTGAGAESVINKGEGASNFVRGHMPPPARAWSPAQFSRAGATVALRNLRQVSGRVAALQGRQRELQRRYRDYMATHPRGPGAMHMRGPGAMHMRGPGATHSQDERWGKLLKPRQEKSRPARQRQLRAPHAQSRHGAAHPGNGHGNPGREPHNSGPGRQDHKSGHPGKNGHGGKGHGRRGHGGGQGRGHGRGHHNRGRHHR